MEEDRHEPLEPSEVWEDVAGYYLEGEEEGENFTGDYDTGVDLDEE